MGPAWDVVGVRVASVLAAEGGEGAEEHVVNELPMDPIWYGVIAFGILLTLLLITLALNKDR